MKNIRFKTWTRLFVLLVLTTATLFISFNDNVLADILDYHDCVNNTNSTFGSCIIGSYNTYQSCVSNNCGSPVSNPNYQACINGCANTHENTSINCNYSWGDSMNSCNSIAYAPIYSGERMCRRQAANVYKHCINNGGSQDDCENEEGTYFSQCLYP